MAAGGLDNPVRVAAVQIAVLIHHFQLKPEAEFQSQRLDFFGKPFDAIRQTLKVRGPVA